MGTYRKFALGCAASSLVLVAAACSENGMHVPERESIVADQVLHVGVDASYVGGATGEMEMSGVISNGVLELSSERVDAHLARARLVRISGPDEGALRSVDGIAPCRLKPGTYKIVDPLTDRTIALLIVFPNCAEEIVPVVGN